MINRRQLLTGAVAGATVLTLAKVVPASTTPDPPLELRYAQQSNVADDWSLSEHLNDKRMRGTIRETRQWAVTNGEVYYRHDLAFIGIDGEEYQYAIHYTYPGDVSYEVLKAAREECYDHFRRALREDKLTIAEPILLPLPTAVAHAIYV